MTSNELEQRLRAYVPVAGRRKPCVLEKNPDIPGGYLYVPGFVQNFGDYNRNVGTVPSDEPPAVLARALVMGVEAVEGKVCPNARVANDPSSGFRMAKGRVPCFPDCKRCDGTGRIGGTRGLSGLLVPCEGQCGGRPFDPGDGDIVWGGHAEDCTGTVLLPLVREALNAGEEEAVCGFILRRVWAAPGLDRHIAQEIWETAAGTSLDLGATIDALDQACGVGVVR